MDGNNLYVFRIDLKMNEIYFLFLIGFNFGVAVNRQCTTFIIQ